MTRTSGPTRKSAEAVLKDIRRAARRQVTAEETIRIVLDGLRGEDGIAALFRRDGISSTLHCGRSKDVREAGKCRPAGDTVRAAELA